MTEIGSTSTQGLRQYLRAAQHYGVDYLSVLASVGISQEITSDCNQRITREQNESLLTFLINESCDPCFGLKAAEFVHPDSFNMLGYIGLNSANLKNALAFIPAYEKTSGNMGCTRIETHHQRLLIRWDCECDIPLVRRHLVDCVLASVMAYGRQFINVNIKPLAVWLEHSAPENKQDILRYQDHFECDVLFNQRASGIWVAEEQLYTPWPQSNPQMLESLLDLANKSLKSMGQESSMTLKVKNLIRLMLSKGFPSRDDVARQLAMSGRTLQRKLIDEGTNFSDVLKEMRRELSVHYLKNTDFTLDEIAQRLGYSGTAGFQRSFKQWTGNTAGSYRRSDNKR